ncbi:MAG: cobalt ECF transporter T component CbiQ [Candidatus Latescibacterota bacterium]
MHHTHIDRYAGLESPIHALDSRAKLVAVLAFVILVVLTPNGWFLTFGLYALLVGAAMAVSKVPCGYILKRSLTILPFALAVSIFIPFITPGNALWTFHFGLFSAQLTDTGLVKFFSLSLKALLSFFATITLVATTPFGDLMKAAGALGMPSRMVVVLSFMYRYLFIIIDEASHMILARDLRGAGKKSILLASGGIVGALLVRSFEHAEKLYYAMLLRGYTGKPVTLHSSHLHLRDIVITVVFFTCSLAGLILGKFLYA